jgi:putative flippase GtrA
MKRHIHTVREFILPIIDFFYPPFRKVMVPQTFRYAAAGGFNTVVGLFVYYICFKFILKEQNLDLGFYAFTPHVAALFMSFCVSFPLGFFLMKYVVFENSTIGGKTQAIRYLMIYIFTLFINYAMLKLLVEILHIFVMLSQLISTAVVIAVSYFGQRYFSFKIDTNRPDATN